MDIRLVADQADTHVHFRVFVNGALAGKLVMRTDEAITFRRVVEGGGTLGLINVISEGRWSKGDDQ